MTNSYLLITIIIISHCFIASYCFLLNKNKLWEISFHFFVAFLVVFFSFSLFTSQIGMCLEIRIYENFFSQYSQVTTPIYFSSAPSGRSSDLIALITALNPSDWVFHASPVFSIFVGPSFFSFCLTCFTRLA